MKKKTKAKSKKAVKENQILTKGEQRQLAEASFEKMKQDYEIDVMTLGSFKKLEKKQRHMGLTPEGVKDLINAQKIIKEKANSIALQKELIKEITESGEVIVYNIEHKKEMLDALERRLNTINKTIDIIKKIKEQGIRSSS